MPDLIIESLANLGAAGLVGLLWVWERATSRRREQQLDESHQLLRDKQQQLDTMVRLVRRNTLAMARIDRTHAQLCRLIERWLDRSHPDQNHHDNP